MALREGIVLISFPFLKFFLTLFKKSTAESVIKGLNEAKFCGKPPQKSGYASNSKKRKKF